MEHEVDGKQTSLCELLGMTPDDAKRITDDFGQLVVSCKSAADLWQRIVEKYGMEAVAMSICMYMTHEMMLKARGETDGR